LWLHFFAKDYYNCLDNNYFELEFYKQYILRRANKVPAALKLKCLQNAFKYIGFNDSSILKEYCVFIGVTIMGYQSYVRRLANRLLQELNDTTKTARFMTKHIVIAKVCRLRHELQKFKKEDSKRLEFFDGIDRNLIEKFWEINILNFEKGQNANKSEAHQRFSDDKIIEIYYCIKPKEMIDKDQNINTAGPIGVLYSENGITLNDGTYLAIDDELSQENKKDGYGLIVILDPSKSQFLIQIKKTNTCLKSDKPFEYEVIITPLSICSASWKIVSVENPEARFKNMPLSFLINNLPSHKADIYQRAETLSGNYPLQEIGTLGRLITDLVFTKQTLKQVLVNFESSAMSGHALKFVLLQLPLVGGTIVTVMTAYGLKKIWGSKYITEDAKMNDVIRELGKTGILVGVTVTGGVIGQIAIPIPIIGA
jgi:hypothetical protein